MFKTTTNRDSEEMKIGDSIEIPEIICNQISPPYMVTIYSQLLLRSHNKLEYFFSF